MAIHDLPPLTALRAFEAAARRSSFKAAAAELFVTPTAISHQIRQLEEHLGVRVLHRTPRAVTLTPEGRGLYDATAAGFAEIGQAVVRLRVRRAPAILTLSATTALLSQWLIPRLAQVRSVLPELDLRLHASDAVADLSPGGIDLAIRYGQGPFPGVDATLLIGDAFAPLCSPGLNIREIADLQHAALIHVDGRTRPQPPPDWSRWRASAGVPDLDVGPGLRLTDGMLAMQAAIAGQGVVIVSLVLAADALASGLLVQPFPQVLPGDSYFFASAPGLCIRPEVAALRDWFKRELGRDRS